MRDLPSMHGTRRETKGASDSTHSRKWAKLGCIFMIILGRGRRELLSILENLRLLVVEKKFKIADGDFNGR